jgi:hypothetical protein
MTDERGAIGLRMVELIVERGSALPEGTRRDRSWCGA